ncbi:MAG: heme o synthase [Cellvibrionaceae bacterium]
MNNAEPLKNSLDENPSAEKASWRDYYEMCKPNVVMMMIVTSIIGMFLAVPGMVPLDALILGNVGIALCAGSAAAVNHLLDRRFDQHMARTHNRPIAKGRVEPMQAIIFSSVLGLIGMAILLFGVNAITAWLTLASLLGYAFVYTLFLKHATPQNIVIGGLAGAAPPLLGWTAVTGEIHHHALLLVLIIFAWTPPHFWALAVYRKVEYAKVNIPMLPVTHGAKYTKIHILLYTLILFAVTLLPYATGMLSWLYLIGAIVLGLGFLFCAIRMIVIDKPTTGRDTFHYSNIYLLAMFIIMLADHYLLPVQQVVSL